MVNANGVKTETTYDAEDRPLVVTEGVGAPEARTKEFIERDKMGNPLQVKDFNGNISTTVYNALDLPWRAYDPTPFDSQFTESAYYKTGKIQKVKNRRGNTTTHIYDALNREIRVTDAMGQTIETTYDGVGNIETVKDKRGILTENSYDELNRLIKTTCAGVRLVTNEYDAVGNLTAVIDANGNRTEYAYNPRNLVETTTHPDGFTETRTYDGVGNLITHTDEENKTTRYTYDKENRRLSTLFAGEKTTHLYDPMGNLVSITKPEGNCRIMAYDAFNRLSAVVDDPTAPIGSMTTLDSRCTRIDGLNLVTHFEYDGNVNLTHQYDPNNRHVEFTHDALNRKTQHIQHKSGGALITQFTTYDEEGNLKEKIDAKNQTFTWY